MGHSRSNMPSTACCSNSSRCVPGSSCFNCESMLTATLETKPQCSSQLCSGYLALIPPGRLHGRELYLSFGAASSLMCDTQTTITITFVRRCCARIPVALSAFTHQFMMIRSTPLVSYSIDMCGTDRSTQFKKSLDCCYVQDSVRLVPNSTASIVSRMDLNALDRMISKH